MMKFEVLEGGPHGSTSTVLADRFERDMDGLRFYRGDEQVNSFMPDSNVMRADDTGELPGTSWPALEDGCPECGNHRFDCVEVSSQGVTVTVDGEGGIAQISTEEPLESNVSLMMCLECGATIVEDGEVVHDEVQ